MSDLINVLGEVKARIQDKLGALDEVDLPMPQFILLGKQSVGKSRLIETLAGESFNFCSGTLGSRRPTVLEFRNNVTLAQSRWYVRDLNTHVWQEHSVHDVMKIVGNAHEMLGATVDRTPVYVRIESKSCVDMQIVDLPGFREFALDESKQVLNTNIERLVEEFMHDKKNVMICVEQASDASNMAILQRCKRFDVNFNRTILVRNKLDKYYSDLTPNNVGSWVDGYGELPPTLKRFALTLPFWDENRAPPAEFSIMRKQKNDADTKEMRDRHLSAKYMETIGFDNFQKYMEQKIESMFTEALTPVLTRLQEIKVSQQESLQWKQDERQNFSPERIVSTIRDCGVSFAQALTHVMDGVINLQPVMTLETELRLFHQYHQNLGMFPNNFTYPSEFDNLDDYLKYLKFEIQIAAYDIEVNGGAQFRRLMNEVEIYLRFSEIAGETKKRDVIQARGVSISNLSWRDVVVKLLSHEAHSPLQRHVQYVGERIKWFFMQQKDVVLEFMSKLEGTPMANQFSPLYPRHATLLRSNETTKKLVYSTYDNACARQLKQFVDLFENMLTSTFSNPWVFLKGATPDNGAAECENLDDAVLPSFDDTKSRIPSEIQERTKIEHQLAKWVQEIPTDPHLIEDACDKVQVLVLKAYSFIRSQVCDQVELFAESFFKLPMIRRLEEDMIEIDLSPAERADYEYRRNQLGAEIDATARALYDIDDCIGHLQSFKLKCEGRDAMVARGH